MESLVRNQVFVKVEKQSVEVTSSRVATVLGYTINEDKLPLESDE